MSRRHSRVPKFGSWDADNIQFSGDFETARKERAAAVGMNPIEQQGNPEAIVPGREGNGNGVHVDSVETLYPSQNQLANSGKSEPGEKPHSEGLGNGKDNSSRRSMGSASAGSDKSIPAGYPPLHQQNSRRTRSGRKKNLQSEFNSFATTPSPVSGTLRSASNASDKDRYSTPNRLASASPSVPKFGAWEEMDTSEGYTVIFDKVKEEKQNASTKFTATAASPKPPNSVKFYQTKRRSKMFCCLF